MELPADYLKMTANKYKTYHESYMQDNHGSTALHTLMCILLTIFCTIISSIYQPTTKLQLLQEYAIIVLPLIFCHTLLADYIYHANILVFILLCIVMFLNRNNMNLRANLNRRNTYQTNRLASISTIRGLTYLITIFAILAVDFRVFPRYLAKTERYGYSLMDTGVGLFILISGLVHKDYAEKKIKSFINDNFLLFIVLSIIGVVRTISVKHLEYQEHVTEYGVHWNFFFTVAVAKALSAIFIYFMYPRFNYLILSFIVLVTHELLLINGVQDWVFSDTPRDSFVPANREGISSCLGYIAMYLFAAHFKKELINHSIIRRRLLYKMLVLCGILWVLAILLNIFRPTSRTLANAGYCLYMEAVFLTIMIILYLFEVAFMTKERTFIEPKMVSLMNEKGLLLFISSNLLTGAINLYMRTLFVHNYVAILLLNFYMLSVLYLAVIITK